MSSYKFATDSETGTLEADTFEAACRLLDSMVEDSDCGHGWVEDTDGYRYETDGEATVEDIGNGFYEAGEGTVIYSPEA